MPKREYINVQGQGGIGQCIRSDRYKYIAFRNDPIELLFDMENDPGEMKNLARDKSYAQILEQHRAMLREHGMNHNDQLALDPALFAYRRF